MNLHRLAQLDAAASPGPWEYGDYNIARSGPTGPVCTGPTVKESLDFDAWERDPNRRGDGPPLWHSTVHIREPAADPKYGSSAYTLAIVPGNKEVRDANCALIAASKGAAPKLLKALEGLLASWSDRECDTEGADTGHCRCECCEICSSDNERRWCADKLRALLQQLDLTERPDAPGVEA